MKTTTILMLIAGAVILAIFLLFLYSMCYMPAKATEREERIHLDAWRKTVTTTTLVKHCGIVYHVVSVTGKRYEVSNHNDTHVLTYEQLYPVD